MSGDGARRVRGWLWRSPVLPGLLIAAMVTVALLSTEPTSGVDVYVRLGSRPYRGFIRVARRHARESVAGHRAGADGHFRLLLAPGFYVLHPVPDPTPGAPAGRDVEIQVKQNRFVAVTVAFRRAPARRRARGRGRGPTPRAGGAQAPPAGP
jgi:hypothetical protein